MTAVIVIPTFRLLVAFHNLYPFLNKLPLYEHIPTLTQVSIIDFIVLTGQNSYCILGPLDQFCMSYAKKVARDNQCPLWITDIMHRREKNK